MGLQITYKGRQATFNWKAECGIQLLITALSVMGAKLSICDPGFELCGLYDENSWKESYKKKHNIKD